MNRIENFLSEINELDRQMYTAYADEDKKRYPIYDGALNPEKYFNLIKANTSPKIMWLMKEPYDEEDGTGGGWGFAEKFKIGKFPNDLVFGGSKPTWQPVVYIVYGILNEMYWDDMDYIRNNRAMTDVLNNIAWVNIQKLPSLRYNSTVMGHVYEAYNNNKELLKKQISLLSPDVIICGGTFNIVCEDLGCLYKGTIGNADYHIADNMVIIDAYHPAYRTNREVYVNSIIDAVKTGLTVK